MTNDYHIRRGKIGTRRLSNWWTLLSKRTCRNSGLIVTPEYWIHSAMGVFFIAVLLNTAALASSQATPPNPAPPPELKKLDFLVGTWKVQGKLKPASPSPGGRFSFLNRYAWMSGRYFLVLQSTTTGALGNATGTSYYGYSPQDKTYTYDAFNSLGQAEHAKGTLEGNTWVWIDTEDFLGQVVKGRYTVTVSSPTSYTFKFEVAPLGGGDYTTVAEGKGTKLN